MENNRTTTRATCWSVTINNPDKHDEEYISLARQRGWLVSGQLEKGESGTPHYQLMVRTPQVRFSAVKRAFPRAHIEIARSPSALMNYVQKAETRIGALPEKDERYPNLAAFWQLVYDYWTRFDKECLDQDALWNEGRVTFFRDSDDDAFERDPLPWLDQAVRRLIAQGYVVESIACNPAVRTAWKRYAREILERCMKFNLAPPETPQTDRQTDSVEIPVVQSTNADESSPAQATEGVLEGLDGEAPSSQVGAEDQEGCNEDCEECDCSQSGE